MATIDSPAPVLDRPLPTWRTVVPVVLAVAMLSALVAAGLWAVHTVLALGVWFIAQ